MVVIVKRHGQTERLSGSNSGKENKDESSEHHYHFLNNKVETKVKRRSRSFNTLFIYFHLGSIFG